MHAQSRETIGPLRSYFLKEPEKELNKMPVDFGREAVRLWVEFANRLAHSAQSDLGDAARRIEKEATDDAERVVKSAMSASYGIKPINWQLPTTHT